MKDWLTNLIKGGVVGGTMLVPGVSGGTTAIIIGIYDKLIEAVSSFTKDIKKNFLFLLFFAIGGGLGFFLVASPISYLIDNPVTHRTALCFFMGIIAAGVPVIIKEAKITKFDWKVPLYVVIGAAIVIAITFIPVSNGLAASGILKYAILFVMGIVLSVALVLPGISFSQMLEVFGVGSQFRDAVSDLDILFLLPIGIGLIVGIFATTKILDKAMKKFPTASYMIILGFIIGSICEIFTEFLQQSEMEDILKEFPNASAPPVRYEAMLCVAACVLGFVIFTVVSRLEEKKTAKQE